MIASSVDTFKAVTADAAAADQELLGRRDERFQGANLSERFRILDEGDQQS